MSTVHIFSSLHDAAATAEELHRINKRLVAAGVVVKDLSEEIASLRETLEDWKPDPTDYEV